jgi:hypothetical protein
MGNLTVAFTFVWMLNLLMFMAQAAMIDMGPDAPVRIFNCNGTIIQSYSAAGNCDELLVPGTNGLANDLPVSATQVSESTGFFLLDVLSSIRTWITNKLTYFTAFVSAPYSILNSIPGLPIAFVGVIGTMWWGISAFLLAAFIFGRES